MGEQRRSIGRIGSARARVPVGIVAIATLFVGALVLPPLTPAAAAGPCTVTWVGASGAWETAANWRDTSTSASRVPTDTDTVCIDDGVAGASLVVTATGAKGVAGLANREELRLSGLLTIGEGGDVDNSGVLVLTNSADVAGTDGGVPERVVNTGIVRTDGSGSLWDFAPTVVVDSLGSVEVVSGTMTVANPGRWISQTPTVTSGSLVLNASASSELSGSWSMTGDGTVRLVGLLQPKEAALDLSFAAGRLDVSGLEFDASQQPISNRGVVTLGTSSFSGDVAAGVGFANVAGGEVRQTGVVTLAEGSSVVNDGLWVLEFGPSSGDVRGTDGGSLERFVNNGALRTSTGGWAFDFASNVRVDNPGTIDVQAGTVDVGTVGVWGDVSPTVAAGSTLTLRVSAEADLFGTWSVTGDGLVRLVGTVQPKSAGLTFASASGHIDVASATLDGSVQPIRNTGLLELAGSPVLNGDVAAGVGFANVAGGEVRQTGVVTLAEGSSVVNDGLWVLEFGPSSGDVRGTDGGSLERFVNNGALRTSTGGWAFDFASNVRVDNPGTIDVQAGTVDVGTVGVWGDVSPTVAAGSTLTLRVSAEADLFGTWSVTGDGLVRLVGTVQPKSAGLTFASASGHIDVASATLDGSVQPIRNTGLLELAGSPVLNGDVAAGVGFANVAGGEVRQTGVVTLAEGSSVVNDGLWVLEFGPSSGDVRGTDGGSLERFVNNGALRTSTGGWAFDFASNVRVDNPGTIDVQAGTVDVGTVGVWGDVSPTVAAGSTLTLRVSAEADLFGTWSVTGDGLVRLVGTVQPKSAGLTFASASGHIDVASATLDGSVQPIRNTGLLELAGSPVLNGDVAAGVGFANVAGGEVRQTGVVTLAEGSSVVNDGLWVLEFGPSSGDVRGTDGGSLERFVNNGALRTSTGGWAFDFASNVRVDNPGTIDVQSGTLTIEGAVPQVTGATLTGGTWRSAGVLELSAAPTLTAIGAGASVELAGAGTFPKLSGLASVAGTLRLSGGKHLTTGSLTSTGSVHVGPTSRLIVNGSFTTAGELVTDIAGTPASGQFGDVIVSGSLGLGGTVRVVRDPAFSPSPDDEYTIARGADRSGFFDAVDAAGFAAAYTSTAFVLNGTGSVPDAAAGLDITVDEATPPIGVVLDGSASTDLDGTITSYAWTAPAGVVLTSADTATAGYAASDDAAFTATLQVCDDDGLCDTDTAAVHVTNVAPAVTIQAPGTVLNTVPFTLGATYTDGGGLDTHMATVDWGAGAPQAVIASGGTVSADHTYDATGVYPVQVCVTDDDGATTCASLDVTVGGNDAPVPVDDAGIVDEDTTVDIDVLANDTDTGTPTDQLAVTAATSGGLGTAEVVDRVVRYTPVPDACGADSFTYTVSDGALTATATVTMTVTCVNDAPVALAGDDRAILEGGAQTLFGGATDVDGDALTAAWTPTTGLDDPGVLQPTARFDDDATTTYTLTVCDPSAACGTDTTTVTVANVAPTVTTVVARPPVGTPAAPTISFVDPGTADVHTATVDWSDGVGPVAVGTVTSPFDLPARSFTAGTHTAQVCVTDDDGGAGCATQTVIARTDAGPDAVDDAVSVAAGSTGNAVDVLANDTDADADPLSIVAAGSPSAGGSVTCTTSCTYAPAPGFAGTETFTYTVTDGVNGEDTATVTVTVEPPNTAPVAGFALAGATGVAPLAVTAAITVSDPDADTLQVTLDWGDGSPPFSGALPLATAPAHTYAAAGTYVARLEVSDGAASAIVTALVRAGRAEPLTAAAGDDQVVSLGAAIHLDGAGSRPLVGIDTYRWVVVDADGRAVAELDGATVEWTPVVAGTYTAQLDVAIGGDGATDTATLTVVDPVVAPGLAVTVRGGGDLLQGADVMAIDADGVRYHGVTGGDGSVRLLGLPDGAVAIYAFGPGFLPAVAQATVTAGGGALTVDLQAGEVAQTFLESRRLSFDEVVALGIDPNAPENQNVFEFEIHLAFTPDDPVEFTGVTNGTTIFGGEYGGGGGGGGGFGDGSGIAVPGHTVYPTVRTVGGQPVIIWLVIPGEARWLKEFFEVRMVVSNLAPAPFTFAGGSATLDALPAGLSLAPTAQPQELAQSLPDIPAGGSAAATWIVRGDVAGSYEVSAAYAASLEPIGAPISAIARTTPGALKVWGGDALTMRVLAEERLIEGHPYRVVVEMTNVSDIPVYNLAVELKEQGKLNYIYQPREELTRGVAELAPGATLRADYVLVPTVGIYTPLRLLEEISFVKKTGGNTELATTVESVPPRFADDQRPAISLSRSGNDITVSWAAVPGATEYQLFTTTAPEVAFAATPIRTVAADTTSITLPLTADLVGKQLAVSPTVDGRPDMVHRRIALLGGSYLTMAAQPTTVDRAAIVGDGLVAGAGLAGGDACGRNAASFAATVAAALGAAGADLANVACDRATAGNVAFAPVGPSLDAEYVTGPQQPLATATQAVDVATFAGAGPPDLVVTAFGAEDLGLGAILGSCGAGCDTRWRATAQAVLRDRVYPRVYENLRALRGAHPGAVVVAIAPPTPVAAGSACSRVGSGAGVSAAESRFLADELFPWLQTTLRRAAINAGVNLVDVTSALAGHQACDAEPWVNGLVLDGSGAVAAGSFLPNAAGHAAIAGALRGVVVDDAGKLLLANPAAEVLRVVAPQEEAPFVVPVTARQVGRCDSTCQVAVSTLGLRNGDRVNVLVGGVAPDPAQLTAGLNGTIDAVVTVAAPPTPTTVVVDLAGVERNVTGSTVVTVGMEVGGPPTAAADAATVAEDGVTNIDVLGNDADPDDDPLTISAALGAGHGTVTVTSDAALGRQVVQYAPAADYCGVDTFTYHVADPSGATATALVDVTVSCVNDAPVVGASVPTTVAEGTTSRLTATVGDVDSTTLTYSWSPVTGLDDPRAVSPTFTATDDGSRQFALTVCDDATVAACTTLAAAATVNVTNVVPAVVAVADTTAQGGVARVLDPIARFTDAGAADTHTATIDWGDGSAVATVPAAGGVVAGTHTYLVGGTFTAKVCVTDDDGGAACDEVVLAVTPPGPLVSIGDVRVTEPNSGAVTVQVPVTLSLAPTKSVSVKVETVDGSALNGPDYTAKTATVSFTPTGALTKLVAISVRGDLVAEAEETFDVRVVPPVSVGIAVADGTGTVTIVDDDDCTIVGTAGADTLTGTAGRDVICALAGDDVIDGRGGADVIRADTGVDTLTYATAPGGVTVDLSAGTASDRGAQTLAGVEQVYGSEHADVLTGGAANAVLVGLGGADTLTGGIGADELDGGDGDDTLAGGDGNDDLYGGDGTDRVTGGLGADFIEGDAGEDRLDGGDGNDIVRGGAGADTVIGGLGVDRIDGQAGDDTLDGGDGNDVLAGGDGADRVIGGLGADELAGGIGVDVLDGGDGNDTLLGDEDADTASGGPGNDIVRGGDGDDTLAGDLGTDRLDGGAGTNTLDGGDGVDSCRRGTATACERP